MARLGITYLRRKNCCPCSVEPGVERIIALFSQVQMQPPGTVNETPVCRCVGLNRARVATDAAETSPVFPTAGANPVHRHDAFRLRLNHGCPVTGTDDSWDQADRPPRQTSRWHTTPGQRGGRDQGPVVAVRHEDTEEGHRIDTWSRHRYRCPGDEIERFEDNLDSAVMIGRPDMAARVATGEQNAIAIKPAVHAYALGRDIDIGIADQVLGRAEGEIQLPVPLPWPLFVSARALPSQDQPGLLTEEAPVGAILLVSSEPNFGRVGLQTSCKRSSRIQGVSSSTSSSPFMEMVTISLPSRSMRIRSTMRIRLLS